MRRNMNSFSLFLLLLLSALLMCGCARLNEPFRVEEGVVIYESENLPTPVALQVEIENFALQGSYPASTPERFLLAAGESAFSYQDGFPSRNTFPLFYVLPDNSSFDDRIRMLASFVCLAQTDVEYTFSDIDSLTALTVFRTMAKHSNLVDDPRVITDDGNIFHTNTEVVAAYYDDIFRCALPAPDPNTLYAMQDESDGYCDIGYFGENYYFALDSWNIDVIDYRDCTIKSASIIDDVLYAVVDVPIRLNVLEVSLAVYQTEDQTTDSFGCSIAGFVVHMVEDY